MFLKFQAWHYLITCSSACDKLQNNVARFPSCLSAYTRTVIYAIFCIWCSVGESSHVIISMPYVYLIIKKIGTASGIKALQHHNYLRLAAVVRLEIRLNMKGQFTIFFVLFICSIVWAAPRGKPGVPKKLYNEAKTRNSCRTFLRETSAIQELRDVVIRAAKGEQANVK